MILRIVLDTNVLVSHFILPNGNPTKILHLALAGKATIVLSPPILEELEDVLGRKLGFGPTDAAAARTSIETIAELVTPVHAIDHIAQDDADNRVLECALSGLADAIVTGDKRHLLPLKQFRGIPIHSPLDFLKTHQPE